MFGLTGQRFAPPSLSSAGCARSTHQARPSSGRGLVITARSAGTASSYCCSHRWISSASTGSTMGAKFRQPRRNLFSRSDGIRLPYAAANLLKTLAMR